jgi:very-short-patch-repair endonuclease
LVFIPTTWEKFTQAVEINGLYDESPLEDRLWAEFKRLQISAERQYYLQINDRNYCLDFVLFCRNGKLDVETDGDTWHRIPKLIAKDNQRNNDVTMAGWYVLRFNSTQINNDLNRYCIPTVVDSIQRIGGLQDAPILKLPAASEQKQGELLNSILVIKRVFISQLAQELKMTAQEIEDYIENRQPARSLREDQMKKLAELTGIEIDEIRRIASETTGTVEMKTRVSVESTQEPMPRKPRRPYPMPSGYSPVGMIRDKESSNDKKR